MEAILKKEIIHFILLFKKFTNKPDFNTFILCQIVNDHLIKERMVFYSSKCPTGGIQTKLYWKSKKLRVLHSYNDLPAKVCGNGDKEWYKNGKLHRDGDLPAIIWSDGAKMWYKNGKIHRDNDQPAAIQSDGTKEWYKNEVLHRDGDKPAMIRANGDKFWYKDGKLYDQK